MEKFLYKRLLSKEPKLNVWWAYPAVESFALASLGYLTIFQKLDLDNELYVERIYSNTKETEIPSKDVDCMGFSVSFEIDILNIIRMLKKYEIPFKAQDRTNEAFIFAGGPVLMSNPIPYEEFFDFISVGEKSCLDKAFEVLKKKNELSRDEILKELSELEGIYVPKYKKDKIKITRDNIENDVVFTPILSEKSFFKDAFVIELERGCPKMCNFCLASWLNVPVRFVNYEKIIEAIDFGLEHTNKIALLGAYVAGHPQFDEIINHIAKKCETQEIELSISSLRADLTDENLVKTLVKCNQKTATIALEAGSQRLRNYIGKDLTKEQILKTVSTAQKGGLRGLKIYLMIGLPTETQEDIEEIVNLAKEMKAEIKKNKTPFEITFSASSFVPKAHTPFEKCERCDKKILEDRVNYLKKNLHKIGIDFRSPSIDWDIVQSILSRYNNHLTDYLIDVVENGGNLGAFKQQWRKYNKKGLLPSIEESTKVPFDNIKALKWEFIDVGTLDIKRKLQERL